MAYLSLRRQLKDRDGGDKSKFPYVVCKKHPKHKQSPGICAVCLRERLSKISSTSSSTSNVVIAAASSCSSSSSYVSTYYSSNTSASSYASPLHHRYRLAAENDEGKKTSKSMLMLRQAMMTKSRSVAVINPGGRECGIKEHKRSKKLEAGFWSKLFHPKTKRRQSTKLGRSRTLRESLAVAI